MGGDPFPLVGGIRPKIMGYENLMEKKTFLLDLDILLYMRYYELLIDSQCFCILLAPPFSEPYLQRLRKWIRMIELNSLLKEQVLMKHHYSIMINWCKLHWLSNASLKNAYENEARLSHMPNSIIMAISKNLWTLWPSSNPMLFAICQQNVLGNHGRGWPENPWTQFGGFSRSAKKSAIQQAVFDFHRVYPNHYPMNIYHIHPKYQSQ